MANQEYDPSLFEEVPQPQGSAQQVAPSSTGEYDSSQFEAVSEPAGKQLPTLANGLTPETAITKSPLTARQHLATGEISSEKGRDAYLKANFEDVRKDADGDYVVKKDGYWHHMRGQFFGDISGIEKTKKILRAGFLSALPGGHLGPLGEAFGSLIEGYTGVDSSLEDAVTNRMVANPFTTASIVASGAIAAPGVALNAARMAGPISRLMAAKVVTQQAGKQAAVALAAGGVRTLWGQIEGTGDDDIETQSKQVGLEMLLNFGGAALPVAIKPSVQMLADRFPAVARALKGAATIKTGLVETLGSSIKKVYSGVTGLSGNNIDNIADHGDEMGKIVKNIAGRETNDAIILNKLTDSMHLDVQELAKHAEEVVTQGYRANRDELIKKAPASFRPSFSAVTDDSLRPAIGDGLMELERDVILVGKAGSRTTTTRTLTPDQAVRVIADAGGKIPKGYRIKAGSSETFLAHMQKAGRMGDAGLAIDPDAHTIMKEYYEALVKLRGFDPKTGSKGVEQLLDLNKTLSDLTWKLKSKGEEGAMNAITTKMASQAEPFKAAITAQFEKIGMGESFTNMNDSYHTVRKGLEPLLQVVEQAKRSGTNAPYERLARTLAAKPGLRRTENIAVDHLAEMAFRQGYQNTSKIVAAQKNISLKQTLVDVIPWSREGLASSRNVGYAAGAALMSGNVVPAAALAGTAVVRSPKIQAAALEATWKLKEKLTTLGAKGVNTLMRTNPQVLSKAFDSVINYPSMVEETKNGLLQGLGSGGSNGTPAQ